MQEAVLSMLVQKRHAHFWSHDNGLYAALLQLLLAVRFSRGAGVRVEDGFAASAGGEVEEESPGCFGGGLVEDEEIRIVICVGGTVRVRGIWIGGVGLGPKGRYGKEIKER